MWLWAGLVLFDNWAFWSKAKKRYVDTTYSLEVDEEGVRISSAGQFVAWENVSRYHDYSDYLMLPVNSSTVLILPHEEATAPIARFIRDKMSKRA